MPKVRCHYLDCGFLDEGVCTAAMVEFDPDSGCMTYSANAGALNGDDWEEEDELGEWEELEDEEEDDELWLDEDEETEA